jgi:hypothetical protein
MVFRGQRAWGLPALSLGLRIGLSHLAFFLFVKSNAPLPEIPCTTSPKLVISFIHTPREHQGRPRRRADPDLPWTLELSNVGPIPFSLNPVASASVVSHERLLRRRLTVLPRPATSGWICSSGNPGYPRYKCQNLGIVCARGVWQMLEKDGDDDQLGLDPMKFHVSEVCCIRFEVASPKLDSLLCVGCRPTTSVWSPPLDMSRPLQGSNTYTKSSILIELGYTKPILIVICFRAPCRG